MNRSAEIAKAREVDTRIAAAWGEYWEVQNKVITLTKQAHEAEKMEQYYSKRPAMAQHYTDRFNTIMGQVSSLQTEALELAAVAQKMDDDEYEGWSRFFLVQHIHSSQHCSSFRPTTRIGWLPNVSGLTEVEAVKEHGETLCTICFPSAPVELTTKPADPNLCTGSGKYHDTEHLTGRERNYTAPSGYCPDCGRWNTVTKTGVMRKHKIDETRRHW